MDCVIRKTVLIFFYCLVVTSSSLVYANDNDNTMLMFVGEDLDILTIASGKEESSWSAPAVVSVIEHEDIQKFYYATLAEALSFMPGFYLPGIDSNDRSYLRGITGSVLYLYDTVPLNFFGNKTLNLIHHDLPLHAIKRIEIVRGPGSVLWGPDAFAGIVNIVPMTGHDFTGVETGVSYNSQAGEKKVYLNQGYCNDSIATFFSISHSRMADEDFTNDITRFWGDNNQPVASDKRSGFEGSDYQNFFEIYGNCSFKNDIKLSGRFIKSKSPYSLKSQNFGVSWKEVRNIQSGFLKIEAKKNISLDSTIRFVGNVSTLKINQMIIDKELEQKEFDYYGEIIYEKAFNSGHSLLTAGTSYRKEKNMGIPVWDSYLPSYLVSENTLFIPNVNQTDYTKNLISIFTQYRMNIGDFDLIVGIRSDDHDVFKDNFSYNSGVIWEPRQNFIIKLLHGTAYRTPTAKQLSYTDNFDLEEIKNYSLEASWKAGEKFKFSVCGFLNDIDNHIMDDPYAGLSDPNSQRIKGVEFEIACSPFDSFSFEANMTLLHNSGPEEIYKYNDYSYLGPDGEIINHYIDINYPFDTGPDKLFNAKAVWQPMDRISCSLQARFFSSYALAYPNASEYENTQNTMLFDIGITFSDFFIKNSDFHISLKNILNKEYLVSGIYSLEKGDPFSISIMWQKQW